MPSVQDLTELLASTPENLSPSHSSSCLQKLNGHHTHPNHFDYSLPAFSDLRGVRDQASGGTFTLFDGSSSSSLARRPSSVSSLGSNGTLTTPLLIPEEDTANSALSQLNTIHEPSPIERLPIEVLSRILYYVNDSATPMTSSRFMLQTASGSSAYYTHIAQFAKILTTSWSFYNAGTPLLYIHVSFSHSNTFAKFLKSIRQTGYGHFVRCIDLADFTSVGLGRTAKMNMEIQNLTSTTLVQLLDLCPNLFEFLASESIELDLSEEVCKRLLCLPHIQALDFCGATNGNFTNALVNAVNFFDVLPAIERLSLHGCSTLPSSLFENLLPKLPYLTHLDLTHTQITAPGLLSINQSTPLKYLSLSRCIKLGSSGILNFFLKHQASRNLIWLNMMCDATRPCIINAEDLESVLNHLPTTLTNLNLYGLPVNEHYFESYIVNNPPFLESLAALSLGHCEISPNCLKKNLPLFQSLSYLDLTGNSHINIWSIQDQDLLNANPNINCFEFSSPILTKLASGMRINGFTITLGQGHRAWLFRGLAPLAHNVQRMRQLQTLEAEEAADAELEMNDNSTNSSTTSIATSSPISFSCDAKQLEQQARLKEGYLRYNAPSGSGSRFDTSNSYINSRGSSRRKLIADIYQPAKEPANVMASSGDMANRYWNKASRKINVCMVGNGGHNTTESRQQRGIYLYYAFRR
ncbi:hypothetical protein NADFUDRAFT_82124 [Nadsonia fulvescens var. elongata DSM 6958]|uniref:RNI-like protein n=1 Tax=Nadsonia fulvescens var. elongata DSM 6958 TaxID=857566 RepID=A0A1E3PN28_9ASCO|nr:hypothetical protein NADFUDRAFT_82124 [Nadsonia fulvescens var. elongata DSM 6958]